MARIDSGSDPRERGLALCMLYYIVLCVVENIALLISSSSTTDGGIVCGLSS